MTIDREKERMSQTFNGTSGHKFLPQVVSTPHTTVQIDSQFNMTGGFSNYQHEASPAKPDSRLESESPFAFGKKMVQDY